MSLHRRYVIHSTILFRNLSLFSPGSFFAASGLTLAGGRGSMPRLPAPWDISRYANDCRANRPPTHLLLFCVFFGRLYVSHSDRLIRHLPPFFAGFVFLGQRFEVGINAPIRSQCNFCFFVFRLVSSWPFIPGDLFGISRVSRWVRFSMRLREPARQSIFRAVPQRHTRERFRP